METKKLLILLSLLWTLGGCTYGIIYTSVTEPLTENMHETPRGSSLATSDTSGVNIPFVAPTNISAEWSSRAIGDAAQKAGFSEIYYADMHTLSILLGLWKVKTVRVYGK